MNANFAMSQGLGSACTGFWDAQAPAPGAWTDSHAYPHLPAMGGIGPDGAVTAAPSVSHAAQVPFMQPTDPGAQSNLFVANLPKGWGEPHLLALFGLCGTVESCFIARCRRTGRSRGYGFVKFATPAEARVAQQNVTGFPVDGRTLVVEFSLSNPEGGVPDLSSPAQHDNVYTKGLPTHWGIRDIVHLFSASGRVVSCRVLAAHAVGLPVAALVQMGSVPEAAHAVATLHNRVLPGGQRPLIVRFAKTSRREAGQAHTPGQAASRTPSHTTLQTPHPTPTPHTGLDINLLAAHVALLMQGGLTWPNSSATSPRSSIPSFSGSSFASSG